MQWLNADKEHKDELGKKGQGKMTRSLLMTAFDTCALHASARRVSSCSASPLMSGMKRNMERMRLSCEKAEILNFVKKNKMHLKEIGWKNVKKKV